MMVCADPGTDRYPLVWGAGVGWTGAGAANGPEPRFSQAEGDWLRSTLPVPAPLDPPPVDGRGSPSAPGPDGPSVALEPATHRQTDLSWAVTTGPVPSPLDPPAAADLVVARPIEVCLRKLTAHVGAFRLGPVDLEVRSGELMCLVGPNGAGKTTLIRSMLGRLPTEGQLIVGGDDPRRLDPSTLRRIGVVPDDPDEILAELSAAEYWELHAHAHARVSGDAGHMLDRAVAIADWLQFDPPTAVIGGYSHGMRKKTQLVAALLHDPALLIVDEPRNGLDPLGIERLEQYLREVADAGTAVIVASHDLRWAERFADRVAVLHRGQLLACGPPDRMLLPGERDFTDAFFRLVDQR